MQSARARFLAVLVLAIVFVSGMIVGAALNRSVDSDPEARETGSRGQGSARGESGDSGQAGERRVPMYARVGLSDAQRAQVDSIVRASTSEIRALRHEANDSIDARSSRIIQQTFTAVRAVMDSAQVAAYDSLLAERDRRRRSSGGDRGN